MKIVRLIVFSLFLSDCSRPAPSSHRYLCDFSVVPVQHPSGGIVPYIGHRVGADAQVEQIELFLKCGKLVVQCP